MKAFLAASLSTAVLGLVTAAASAADLAVMTQNQYLAGDIAPLVEPGLQPEEFFARVVVALQEVAASKPTERFAALAGEIRARKPHLVGLQEVFSFECEPITQVNGCLTPFIAAAMNNHLAGTMAALGNGYYEVGRVTNLDVTLPLFLSPEVGVLIRVKDRDVILARSDVPASSKKPTCVRDDLRLIRKRIVLRKNLRSVTPPAFPGRTHDGARPELLA